MPESRDDYRKTYIRIKLINELRSRSMTLADICDFLSAENILHGHVRKTCKDPSNYKVCKRTAEREIGRIKAEYKNQLDYNKEFGTYKLDLYDFPDTIDAAEIQALDVALQKMNSNKNAKKLLENLKSKLTTRLYHKIEHTESAVKASRKINEIDERINSNYAFVGPHLITDFDDNIKTFLDFAICNLREVRFLYYKKKEHTVHPLGIMYGPNNVYLIAYECEKGKVHSKPRHYILSEISNLTETKVQFEKYNDFSIKEYANSMFGIYNDGTMYDVEWLIKNPKTIGIAKKYSFHTTQQFIDNPDGSLTVKMHTGGLQAISSFLATWDGKIIPIKPKELVDAYKKLLQNCTDSIK